MHHKYRALGARDFNPTGRPEDGLHWEPGDIIDSKDVPGWALDGWRAGGFVAPMSFEEGEELTVSPIDEIARAISDDERV